MKKFVIIPTSLVLILLAYLSLIHFPIFYPKQVGFNSNYVYGDRLDDLVSLYRKNTVFNDRIIKLIIFSRLLVERITDDQLLRVKIDGVLIKDHPNRADIIETRKEIRRNLDKDYVTYISEFKDVEEKYFKDNRDILNEIYENTKDILEEEAREAVISEINNLRLSPLEYVFGRYIEYVIEDE